MGGQAAFTARVEGLIYFCSSIVFLSRLTVGGVLIDRHGYRFCFGITACFYFVSSVCLLWLQSVVPQSDAREKARVADTAQLKAAVVPLASTETSPAAAKAEP